MAIIFIPGIKATALANINSFDFKLMYENYDTLGGALGSTVMGVRFDEQLQLNPRYDSSFDTIIERNHIMTYPYKNSMNDITDSTGEPVYLFGYDWRKSNVDNAQQLSSFVEYLKGKRSETSFSFITHSMGAMVMCCYLKTLNGDYSVINKIIFTAPPFRGGMEAIKHMAMGNGGFRGFLHMDEGSRKAVRTYPALYELSPWYVGAVKDSTGKPLDLSSKSHWQSSIWDDLLPLFTNRLESLMDFRNNHFIDLNDLPADVRSRCLAVAGTGADTLKEVTLIGDSPDKMFYDFENAISTDDGDCTVPLVSSTIYSKCINTIVVKKGNFFHEGMASVSYHALFLTHSKVLNVVKRFLNNQTTKADWFKSIDGNNDVTLL